MRFPTYSVKSLFLFSTLAMLGLSLMLDRARRQKEAVEAIEALGGIVVYNDPADVLRWEDIDCVEFHVRLKPAVSDSGLWNRLPPIIGRDFFVRARAVIVSNVTATYSPRSILYSTDVEGYGSRLALMLPHLKQLPCLESVCLERPGGPAPDEVTKVEHHLTSALPHCVVLHERGHVTAVPYLRN